MEQSSAIKCPTISYHLVGTKKIQQDLAKPGVIERYLLTNILIYSKFISFFMLLKQLVNSEILCLKEKCKMDNCEWVIVLRFYPSGCSPVHALLIWLIMIWLYPLGQYVFVIHVVELHSLVKGWPILTNWKNVRLMIRNEMFVKKSKLV